MGLLAAYGAWAQDGVLQAAGTVVAAEKISLLQLIMKGGIVMIPLAACSVIALALGIERAFGLRRARIIPPGFMDSLKNLYRASKDRASAAAYCAQSRSPLGNVFKIAFLYLPRGAAMVEKAIEDAAASEVDKMKRSLRGLAIIASVAPLLGLLGTVYGMIGAFQKASSAGLGKAEDLANGIYEALVTTAAGLTIAIPVLLLYQYYNHRVDAMVDDFDELGMEFLGEFVHEEDKSAGVKA
jgi:biopolymer transport protein ExbB